MKQLVALSMLLCFYCVKAQGPQQLVSVPVNQWGTNANGWLYLPADYYSTTKNYPVVFFYHGVGEAGTNPWMVLGQGLPNLIANGMRPDNIINPSDGLSYSFIVLSMQAEFWSPPAEWLPFEINWLRNNYRVDTTRFYVTGLSAGGQASFSTTVVNPEISKLIAAAVPMSPAGVGAYDPTLINSNKIETWFFAGDNDGIFTINAENYHEECNDQYPGSSSLNMYGGGHCCWNTYYDINWHDPGTGLSIWEWMLTNKRDNLEPLPVSFIAVQAQKVQNGILIGWNVEGEEDVARYEVEKSTDGRSFYSLGSIPATGSPYYSFTDAHVQANSYYRVKIVDGNGRYRYSSITHFSLGKSAVVLKAFPMPVHSELTLQHPTAATHSRIVVYGADGRLIHIMKPRQGAQQTVIDMNRLRRGTYFLQYEDGKGGEETLTITKQ